MRPIELALISLFWISLLEDAFGILNLKDQSIFLRQILDLSKVFLFLIHLVVEKPVWQLSALYLLLAIQSLTFLGFTFTSNVFFLGFTALILIVSTLIWILLPVPVLPKPPKAIGTTTFFVDLEGKEKLNQLRIEKHMLVKNQPLPTLRDSFSVRVWYPTHSKEHKLSHLIDHASIVLPNMVKTFSNGKLPEWLLSHLRLASGNAIVDGEVSHSKPKFPVLIFSSGLTGVPDTYSFICENLAANGYIVFSIWHSDGSAPILINGDGVEVDSSNYVQLAVDGADPAAFHFRNFQLSIRLQEVLSLTNYFQKLNADTKSLFHNKLDLTNGIGIIGHSFGGATAIASSKTIESIKCGVSLDGWMWPVDEELRKREAKSKQVLFINSDIFQWKDNIDRMNQISNSSQLGYLVDIVGTSHHNYNDFGFYLPRLGKSISTFAKPMLGPIDVVYALKLTVGLSHLFFQHHLVQHSKEKLSEKQLQIGPEIKVF